MKKYLKQARHLIYDSLRFFYKGFKENLLRAYVEVFFYHISRHLAKFHYHLSELNVNHQEEFRSLQKRVKGLHALLPHSEKFSYSILIELNQPEPILLQSCLYSACRQSPPHFEILLGSKKALSSEVLKMIEDVKVLYPDKIKNFDFSKSSASGYVYNLLAQKAKGNFLFILGQEDWIRPDFLYRYEQVLRTFSQPNKKVLYCSENVIDEKDHLIPGTTFHKKTLHFPFVFQRFLSLTGLLIPKELWVLVKGLHCEFEGAEADDFLLRLDLANTHFINIPLCLYSRRKKAQSDHKKWDLNAFLGSLRAYCQSKNLDWIVEKGYGSHFVRAIPQHIKDHHIQIIIPFKDQKEMTLRCIDSVLKQKGVNFKITAIDNGSHDPSIGQAMSRLDVEVLRIEEPFNYSRLNNLALAQTKTAKECDLLLFLNNDVELDDDALVEMTRWIDQPSIGMVGARLHYPNGQLQHGGVTLEKDYLPGQLWWEHHEKFKLFEELEQAKCHSVVDALTAACALIKKEIFLAVGGFDEICYPIAYSDTNLAVKLARRGWLCFYTPYASGVHHESLSRSHVLEDVESSKWLHELSLN